MEMGTSTPKRASWGLEHTARTTAMRGCIAKCAHDLCCHGICTFAENVNLLERLEGQLLSWWNCALRDGHSDALRELLVVLIITCQYSLHFLTRKRFELC